MNHSIANTPPDIGAGFRTQSQVARPSWKSQRAEAGSTAAYLAVLFIVGISFLRPFEWVSIVYKAPVGYLAGGLSVLVILAHFIGHQKKAWTPELKWFVLVCLQVVLAVPFAHWRGGAFEKVRHDVAVVLLMVVAIGIAAGTVARVRQLLWTMAASMTVLTLVALESRRYDSEGRLMGLGGTYSNANDFGGYLAIVVPLCLFFLFAAKGAFRKVIWGVIAGLMTFAILATMSRSGMLALGAGTVTLLWNYGSKQRKRAALLLLAVLFAGVLGVLSTTHYGERLAAPVFGNAGNASDPVVASAIASAQDRQRLFWRAVDVSLKHPLLGVGAGNFVAFSGSNYDDWHVSHNTFLQLSVENGIPALLFYILMLWAAFRHLRALSRKPDADAGLLLMIAGLRAAMVAMLVAIFFSDTGYLLLPYFFPALAGALWNAEIGRETGIDKQKAGNPRYRFAKEHSGTYAQNESRVHSWDVAR